MELELENGTVIERRTLLLVAAFLLVALVLWPLFMGTD